MANIIIKSDERIGRQNRILSDYGYDESASAEIKEHADHLAEKSYEALEELRRRRNGC